MANIKISDYGYEIQVIAEPGGIVILREGDKCFNEVRSMLPYIRRLIEEVKSEPKPAEKSMTRNKEKGGWKCYTQDRTT